MSWYGEDLAYVHDAGYSRIPRWVPLARDARVVELGCGSGHLAEKLCARGCDVLGVDASPAMLALARRRAPKARFIRGDALSFPLPACDAIYAIGEVLGYSRRGSPAAFFRRAARALSPGGVLAFDLLKPGYGARSGFTEGRDWLCLFDNRERGCIVERRIVTLRKIRGGWRRSDETHRVRAFAPPRILAALRAAGFRASARSSGFDAAYVAIRTPR